ncbi:phenylalanine--tRNA ligase subunit beta [bacterium]|nr:phenylalanine--tRNA ligase subunit beta [bacterium]
MNILVPMSWLGEYLQTDLAPAEIARWGALHGPSFEHILEREGEAVFDIEITTNRVDAMCIKGLARELAAILGDQAAAPRLHETVTVDLPVQTKKTLPVPEIVVETEVVNKIMCVVLDKVANVASPARVQKRLRQIEQNTHGVIIDMTNYMTHELGHPCHAFDYDKIMALGGKIVIKQAQAGKKFVTLDGNEYTTVGGEVVFENDKGEIIDLPAIKGTLNTAIDQNTQRVLFWLENMSAPVVRQASMSHAIRTVAAILNEKNVDPNLAAEVLVAGCQMLQKEAGAKIASPVYTWTNPHWQEQTQPVDLHWQRLRDYLGVTVERERVERYLTDLGFTLVRQNDQVMSVRVPSFRRHDVTIEQDLIEEVARLYGYHNLPSRLDFPVVDLPVQPKFDFALETAFKHFLVDNGLSEVYTYWAVGRELLTNDEQTYLRLENPLTDDKVYLRQQLLPSLQKVYVDNRPDKREVAGIFEMANVYFPGKTTDSVDERWHLALVTTLPYRQLRALIEKMLRLGNISVDIDQSGVISAGRQHLGSIQSLTEGLLGVELEMSAVLAAKKRLIISGNLATTPIVHEDITFVIDNVPISDVIKRMQQVSPLIKRVQLGEIYRDHYTFHLEFQDPAKNLTSSELLPVRQAIVATMNKIGAKLVGQLSAPGGIAS